MTAGMTLHISLRGLKSLQRANQQLAIAVKPKGGLGRAIQLATVDAHRHAIWNTPWDTTVLRHSHRVEVKGAKGRIFIDPAAFNVARGRKPAVYGAELHTHGMRPGRRGGVRAFYQYTVEHDGPEIASKAIKRMLRDFP
jgi:hypothetical protein